MSDLPIEEGTLVLLSLKVLVMDDVRSSSAVIDIQLAAKKPACFQRPETSDDIADSLDRWWNSRSEVRRDIKRIQINSDNGLNRVGSAPRFAVRWARG
jgi:hypothetical protein